MIFNINKPAKTFLQALLFCLITIPLSRFISPRTFVDGHAIYLAWLPLSITVAMLLLYGRHAVLPLIVAFALTNDWMLHLPAPQACVLLFCQLVPVFLACGIARAVIGRRWRFGMPNKHLAVRIVWIGFFAPLALKAMMLVAGRFLDFPLSVSSYFGHASVIYTVIDIQSLICAALIFSMLFYYPLRMLLNPNYARVFWRRHIKPAFVRGNRLFTFNWLSGLATTLALLCSAYQSDYVAGYLVPVIFILFFLAISHFSYPLISLLWAATAMLLVIYNSNFLHGVNTHYALSFVLSVLISFTVCMLYMAQIYSRGMAMKRKWQEQALQDPLTGLPNLRALECALAQRPKVSVCCLRVDNMEFLSRHYGMMMRVHCKRMITADLQPLLGTDETIFQLPGSELLLVLDGPDIPDRLSYLVDYLNSRKYEWHANELGLEFGASWGVIAGEGEDLHHTLGQLSWLSEQACSARRVLALNTSQAAVWDNTTERVLQLSRVKRAMEEGGLLLYAQPIENAEGDRYHEILTRMTCDGEFMTPDRFIPLIAQFNLSKRFDMLVLETLFRQLKDFPGARFSVNLMPFTLMQKESGNKVIALFRQYGVAPASITLEITEEQAFSNSEVSVHNIQQLRDFGCQIAIDDFGTGYANYERLKRLQADIVKIDGCFVRDLLSDQMDAMIVRSMCEMAKVKHLTVVAEYVETEAQRALLYQLGVEYLQGYLVGKPQPLAELRK